MVFEHTERQTGQEAVVKVGTEEIPVTNVTWDRTVNETDVQHNNSLWATNVDTGLRVSGSIEYEGSSEEFRDFVWYDEGDSDVQNGYAEAGQPKRLTMTVRETQGEEGASGLPRTFTFVNTRFVGESPDYPSDGVRSVSWDFTADQVYKSD